MITIHNIKQGSEEWFTSRLGMLSASKATEIGANGAGLVTLCKKLAMERLGIFDKNNFTNEDIERGNRLEPIARLVYEFEFGVKVDEVGGITNDKYDNVWISPDGIIGDDGGCEIKARNDEKHFGLLIGDTKEIPFNQIQMSMLVSERKWWDFISYNPNFKNNSLFVKRIYPDESYFKKLIIGFESGNSQIKGLINIYKSLK